MDYKSRLIKLPLIYLKIIGIWSEFFPVFRFFFVFSHRIIDVCFRIHTFYSFNFIDWCKHSVVVLLPINLTKQVTFRFSILTCNFILGKLILHVSGTMISELYWQNIMHLTYLPYLISLWYCLTYFKIVKYRKLISMINLSTVSK